MSAPHSRSQLLSADEAARLGVEGLFDLVDPDVLVPNPPNVGKVRGRFNVQQQYFHINVAVA